MAEQGDSRRNFLVKAIIGMGALLSVAVAAPLSGFGILPVLRKKDPGWSDAGAFADLGVHQPEERRFVDNVTTGWQEERVERTVWLVKQQDGSVTAFAPSCPHHGHSSPVGVVRALSQPGEDGQERQRLHHHQQDHEEFHEFVKHRAFAYFAT